MVDIEKNFKTIVKKGKVVFGAKQTMTSVKDGKAKLIIIADNCPNSTDLIKKAKNKKIPFHKTKSNSVELGSLCGKAYAVSTFSVLDDGGVNISHLLKKGS